MWGTGRRAGEANVTEGLGVDPPPPPTRGGWLKYPEPDVLIDTQTPGLRLPRAHTAPHTFTGARKGVLESRYTAGENTRRSPHRR